MSKERDKKFAEVWANAMKLAVEAGNATKPRPMVVGQAKGMFSNEIDYSKPTYYEPEGVCGFAWVNVKKGNAPFANWLKKNGYARPDSYYGGVTIWVSDYNQSMQRKEAHARALAEAINDAEVGVSAYMSSRLD